MSKLWRNYNLSIVLLILFLVAWVVQTFAGWQEFADGYIWSWAEATFENWQSEFLQLFSMVVLTSFLIHKGSAASELCADVERSGSVDLRDPRAS